MARAKVEERGQLILKGGAKQGHCGVCDEPKRGRVSAETLWTRMRARVGNGFVRIEEKT